MADDPWPHIGPDELKALWERYRPPFLRLDDPEQSLPRFRHAFLVWLEAMGIDIAPKERMPRLTRRLRLDTVRFVQRGADAETAIALSLNGSSIEVSRAGRATPDEIIRMSAETTLDALHHLVPKVGFGLERAFIVKSPSGTPAPIAIVVVRDTQSLPAAQFVGAADLSVSASEAGAKATLDAVNRRVERETALAATG